MLNINKIAQEYMGKLYYFSLKKTSITADAEDLTQEILTDEGCCPFKPCKPLKRLERNFSTCDTPFLYSILILKLFYGIM